MPQFIKLTRNNCTVYHNIHIMECVWVETLSIDHYKLGIAYGEDNVYYYDYDTEEEANKVLETIVQNHLEVK